MTQELHYLTAPRPATLSPEDFSTIENQETGSQSKKPAHLVSEFNPTTQGDYLGWWHWEDANGNVVSKSFFSALKPEMSVLLDIDHDGDTDYLIQYEGGYTEVSYSILEQLQSTEIRAMANPTITRDISYWLEDHFPGASAYQTPAEQWTHIVLEAGALQMYTALSNYFDDIPPSMEPQMIQSGAEEIIGRFVGKLLQAVVDEKEIGKQNKTPPENERWVVKKGLLEQLGWDEDAFQARVAKIEALHQNTTDHILQLGDRIAVISDKARGTAEKIGKADGGIGIVLDGSTLPKGYATVTNLVVGGPALKAGLKIGDKITYVGNRSLDQLNDEEDFLGTTNAFSCLHRGWTVQHAIAGAFGSTIDITVQRKGHPRTFHVARNFQLSSLRFAGQIP